MRAFQVVVGTEAIPSGLPRFEVGRCSVGPRGFFSQDGVRRCIEAGQGTGRCTHPHRPGCQSWCGPRESGEVGTGHCTNGKLPGAGVGHVDHFFEEGTEGCSGDAFGSTDQSSRSFHRTFQEGIEQFDVERAAEVQRLEESQKRLEELRAMVLVQPVAPQPVDASAEVSLQQMVLDLQRQLQGPVAPLVVSPFRIRKREDYVPATEEEVLEWLADRQEDMNTALMAGNPVEAGRISGLITDATRSLRPTGVEPSMVSNMVR